MVLNGVIDPITYLFKEYKKKKYNRLCHPEREKELKIKKHFQEYKNNIEK